MCKLINGNQYNFISLDRSNKMFLSQDEKAKNKELEDSFFNELSKKDLNLISKNDFNQLINIINIIKYIEKLNNNIASIGLDEENNLNEILAKKDLLANAYKQFNEIVSNTIL